MLIVEPTFPLVAPFAGNSLNAGELVVPFEPPKTDFDEPSTEATIEMTPPPPPPPGPSFSLFVIN